jgi:thioredoxin reductase
MNNFDAIILGGGAAGLSAATALGRFRRRVAVVDAGAPRNAPAEGVHNFLTRDGLPPLELQRLGREQAERYGVTFIDASIVTVEPGFVVNGSLAAPRLIVATGAVDRLPDIPGLAERWGRDVIHCPYCHGWEVRDRAIGILGTHARVGHIALLFRQLSADVTVFLDIELPDEERALLEARGIRVIDRAVVSVNSRNDVLRSVTLEDGSTHAIDALAVASRVEARADFLAPIGLVPVEHPSGAGTHLAVDAMGLTSVPGVWAIGNVADPMAQVVTSASQGLMAAAALNADLVMAEARSALAAR